MITIDDISKPGSTVLYDGRPTTVLTGHYEDPELGWMLKTSLFPGGMPANKYTLPTQVPGPVETVEVIQPVSFELAIIDEVEPIKLTAALIREKSKALTDLSIKNMFDEAGYNAVKKAVTKAVKTRTSIEKKEKEILDAMKLRHASEKKEVTDYTAELYIACREAQTALEAKLTVIDVAKKAAQDKLDADELERTTGRDNKLFELGMTFNGHGFIGYGKVITKNSLYSLSQQAFDTYVQEIEALQLEQGVTGEVKETPKVTFVNPDVVLPNGRVGYDIGSRIPSEETKYPTAIYDREIQGGIRLVLTKGEISDIEHGAVVINERVAQSGIFVQVIDYTK